jgi:rSAM/selenodomain-associated transferase 2/rSAM/selenodomain-associated transferase 1
MTEHTLKRLSSPGGEGIEIEVRFEGGDESLMKEWLGEEQLFAPQGAGDLGQRMERAFKEAFEAGAPKTVIVGSDCPELDLPDVLEALALLDDNPVVIGPALDGGYYLLAMASTTPRGLYQALFSGIPWGTGEVMWRTVNALAEAQYDLGLLDEKADVDEEEDLIHWQRTQNASSFAKTAEDREHRTQETTPGQWLASPFVPSKEPEPDTILHRQGHGEQGHHAPGTDTGYGITIIIPTLNEEEGIGELLDSLQDQDVEVIVADGGSTDRTVEICRQKGVKIVKSPVGRAVQMNAGADQATGNILLFLHADTTLPNDWTYRVRDAIYRGAVAGAFLFGTDREGPAMNFIENGAHFRAIRLGIVFGDQAVFSTSTAFNLAGRYPEQAIMEDYELWKGLGKVGKRTIIPLQVTTSARKWTEGGVWRTTLVNMVVTWLYILGVGPERLARLYRRLTANSFTEIQT